RGVAHSQEEEEHRQHQDQPGDDVVLQAGDHHVDVLRHVGGDLDDGGRGIRRQRLVDHRFDRLRGLDDVFAGAVDDVERDHRVSVQPREAGAVLEAEVHTRHVADVDRQPVTRGDDDVLDQTGVGELPVHAHQVLLVPDVDRSSGNGEVLGGDGAYNVLEAEPVELELGEVHLDLHLTL